MLPGRQVAEKRPGDTKGQAEPGHRHLLPGLPWPAPQNPQEDRTLHFLLEALSVPCAFCPLGPVPKWRTRCHLGAWGQGQTIINRGALLPHLLPGASFPLDGEAAPSHTQQAAEGGRPMADGSRGHRRPWGLRPPQALVSLPLSPSSLVPLVSAGAWGDGETGRDNRAKTEKQQWSENSICEGPPQGRDSRDVTGWLEPGFPGARASTATHLAWRVPHTRVRMRACARDSKAAHTRAGALTL